MRSDIYNSAMAKGAFAIAIGVFIWLIPMPEGLKDPRAWKLLAIFVSTIVAFILQPLPMGTISCIAIAVLSASRVLTINEALSGFSNSTVWLVVAAFIFARAFINANLGRRIAYLIIRAIGTSPLKLAYALCLSDLVIAPATPSTPGPAELFIRSSEAWRRYSVPNPDRLPVKQVLSLFRLFIAAIPYVHRCFLRPRHPIRC